MSEVLTDHEQQIIKMAAEAGAKAALEAVEGKQKRRQKSAKQRKLHNTKELLRNYRMLCRHAECAVYDAKRLQSCPEIADKAVDIIDLMWDRPGNETIVESIKQGAVRTATIIEHVNEMLALYEAYCQHSGRIEDERRLRVLKALYINEDQQTVQQVAAAENVDERTIYRDVDAAVDKLSALIFGIDGLDR